MKKSFVLALFAITLVSNALAQEKKNSWFAVHEDIVIPAQDEKYQAAMKALKEACVTHKVASQWTSVRHDDFSYIHLAPISKFGDLDKDMFGDLRKKMGDESFGKMMAGFDGCYETHSDFILAHMPEHSYLQAPEGENYREVTSWNVFPGKEMEAEKILADWKKLYESKKATDGYAVYKVVMGRDPGYALVSWGKNRVDAATKSAKTWEMFGKDADDLLKRTMAITQKMSDRKAWILPDYSYTPPAATAANK